MFIRSERLFLRPIWPEDWQDLHDGISDEAVVRNLARAPWPYLPEDARDFAALARERHHPEFLITLPGGQGTRTIGAVGLARQADGGGPELGYWIARKHWGRGFATEAARAALSAARALGHRTVRAAQFLDNPASGKVLAKLGFRRVATADRWSSGRNALAPAAIWSLDLGESGDCAGGGWPPQAAMAA